MVTLRLHGILGGLEFEVILNSIAILETVPEAGVDELR
jgi:hypothetical protein